ncbi:MAG: superoxide dismutase, Ni [Pseudomonadota bacterium]
MRWFKDIPDAHAHCDIPCGIYDPATAQQAALSVCRFLDLIKEAADAGLGDAAAQAKVARLAAEKEKHAKEVKAEVVIIWGDYFKAPQIEKYPEIHELTHSILLQASACKQGVDPNSGRKLVDLVNRFAEIYWTTKGVAVQKVKVPYEPKLEIVQGVFEAAS